MSITTPERSSSERIQESAVVVVIPNIRDLPPYLRDDILGKGLDPVDFSAVALGDGSARVTLHFSSQQEARQILSTVGCGRVERVGDVSLATLQHFSFVLNPSNPLAPQIEKFAYGHRGHHDQYGRLHLSVPLEAASYFRASLRAAPGLASSVGAGVVWPNLAEIPPDDLVLFDAIRKRRHEIVVPEVVLKIQCWEHGYFGVRALQLLIDKGCSFHSVSCKNAATSDGLLEIIVALSGHGKEPVDRLVAEIMSSNVGVKRVENIAPDDVRQYLQVIPADELQVCALSAQSPDLRQRDQIQGAPGKSLFSGTLSVTRASRMRTNFEAGKVTHFSNAPIIPKTVGGAVDVSRRQFQSCLGAGLFLKDVETTDDGTDLELARSILEDLLE